MKAKHCKREKRKWVANSCRGPGACNCDCQQCDLADTQYRNEVAERTLRELEENK